MNEKLILEFCIDNNIKIYDDSNDIFNLQTVGDMVIFYEESICGHYREQHMIPIYDILAWVYSRV